MEKTFWEQGIDESVTLWKKIDEKDKKKKMTPKEPRMWEEDMDNMRETMRRSYP